jgi:rhodanese-related sulfurtransferase
MNKLFRIALFSAAAILSASGQEIENVGPAQALELTQNPSTFLVDVRSVAEYALVGHPVMAFNVPLSFWSETEATFVPNDDFVRDLQSRFKPEDVLVFICRGGGRSLRAAQAARQAGFAKVVNVTEGFEGKRDADGHFTVGGWKPAGLPYTYEIDPKLAYPAKK